MKKAPKKYFPEPGQLSDNRQAPLHPLQSKVTQKEVKDFTYQHFKKILARGPFTITEWADMLFMSERTLHRYAKENGSFNGLQIERILLLKQLIDAGNKLFGNAGFKAWLQSQPYSLHGKAAAALLRTHTGIQELIDLMGRLQHGISA
ncbi:hypothetical protein GCM10027051_08940 [Niabella terrae]